VPETIDTFPRFTDSRYWKYDWMTWGDGQVWKFTRAELEAEYSVSIATFTNSARVEARRRGKRVRARVLDAGQAVGIQFFDPGCPHLPPSSPPTGPGSLAS
jgi:hypothetical protein